MPPARATTAVNSTAAALLGLLHDGPMSGAQLVEAAADRFGSFFSVTRSQVYRELTALEAAGLVVAGDPGPRDRRPYELTSAGKAAFRDWLSQEPGQEQIRYPLLLTIAFGRHLEPARLASFVAAHRSTHAGRLEGYRKLRDDAGGGLDAYATATLDFGIRYEQAVLDWFDHLPNQLTGEDG